MLFELCSVIVFLLGAVTIYCRYCRAGRLMALIPGPKPLPLIGNALDLCIDGEALFKLTRRLHSDFGGSISCLSGMNQRSVNIYEPEDIEVILSSTKYNEKDTPYTFLHPWLEEGLLVSNGAKWQHRRKLLTASFHFNILKKFTSSFNEHTAELIELLRGEVGKEKTDVTPLITDATLRIMCETSMGISKKISMQTTSAKYFEALRTLQKSFIYRISRLWLFPDWTYNLSASAKIRNKALKIVHGFTDEIIKKRREDSKSTKEMESLGDDEIYGIRNKMAMLDLLLEQEKEGNIDAIGIREEVDTFMFEGHDTTASSLRFMLMRIANEPVIQDQIYEELKSIFGDSDRPTSMEDLNTMKFLERCIKESLRLYPGVPYMSRMLRKEVVLNGYTIPPNTMCSFQIFDIHRREKLFPNPELFDPDRFLPENVAKRHPYAYIPFSAGPRNCIGQKFAMLEMKTVMSGLLRQFRVEPVTRPEDIVFTCDLVLQSVHPIYVRFCHRKN